LNHFVGNNVEYDMSLCEEFKKAHRRLGSSGKGKPGFKGLIKTSSFTMGVIHVKMILKLFKNYKR